MIKTDKNLKSILEIRCNTQRIFFHKFEEEYKLPDDFNYTQIKVVMTLGMKKKSTMSELSETMLLEKGSFTPIANKLIKNDYIRKIRSKEDKRVYNIELTEKGYRFEKDFRLKHLEYINKTFSILEEDELKEYLNAINKINSINRKLEKKIFGKILNKNGEKSK